MKPKRIFTLILTILLALNITACGDDKSDNGNSVKVSESIKLESTVTYDEAIEDFKYDENISDILLWTKRVSNYISALYYQDIGSLFSCQDEQTGEVISNVVYNEDTGIEKPSEEAITKYINKLEDMFKSVPKYTEYMQTAANATLRDAYIKFAAYAKEIHQEYSKTRPTYEDHTVSINSSIWMLSEYLSYFNEYYTYSEENMEPNDYLLLVLSTVWRPLENIAVYCTCSEKWFSDQLKLDNPSFLNFASILDFSTMPYSDTPKDFDVDFELSQLEKVMAQKNAFDAIAAKALKNDEAAIKVYDDFMKEAKRLYEIVRLHRPEDASTDFVQKYDYNLDKLYELKEKLDPLIR